MSIFGSIAIEQSSTELSVSSLSAPAIATTLGDLVVVAVRWGANSTATCSISDTAGNTYVPLTNAGGSTNINGNLQLFYVLSAKANAANAVKATFSTATSYSYIFVWDIPITGGTASFDEQATNTSGTAFDTITTSAFATTGTDELVFVSMSPNAVGETSAISQSGYTLDSASVGASTYGGAAHGVFSSPQATAAVTMTYTPSGPGAVIVAAGFYGTPSGPSGGGGGWMNTQRDFVNKRCVG